jgi:hypothetical protein
MFKKIVILLYFLNGYGYAYAIDYAKTCDIASKYVSTYYPLHYDYYIGLFAETSANTKDRIDGINFIEEHMEQYLDKLSNELKSIDSSDKFAVMAVYKLSFRRMDTLATKDASTKKNKQSKERLERTIFTECMKD